MTRNWPKLHVPHHGKIPAPSWSICLAVIADLLIPRDNERTQRTQSYCRTRRTSTANERLQQQEHQQFVLSDLCSECSYLLFQDFLRSIQIYLQHTRTKKYEYSNPAGSNVGTYLPIHDMYSTCTVEGILRIMMTWATHSYTRPGNSFCHTKSERKNHKIASNLFGS